MEKFTDEISQFDGVNSIGIHVALPDPLRWNPTSEALFCHIISGAITRSGCYVLDHESTFPDQFALTVASKGSDLCCLVSVTGLATSLKIAVSELKALHLLDGSHVAWHDPRERVWMAFHPNPAIVPFDVLVTRSLDVSMSRSPDSATVEFIESMRKIEHRSPNTL